MIIPMLCVTIFVILVVWFLLPRVARLMILSPTAISIFLCLSMVLLMSFFFFFNDTSTTEFYTLSLHDALPISAAGGRRLGRSLRRGDVGTSDRAARHSFAGQNCGGTVPLLDVRCFASGLRA